MDSPNPDQPVDLTRGGAERIARAVRYVERNYRLPAPARRKYPVGGSGSEIRKGILTTSLTARSGTLPATTPGTGTFSFRTFDGTTMSTGSDTFTVRNDSTTSISSGKVISVFFSDGAWWLLAGDC